MISFRFVSFRFVLFRFVSFYFVSFRPISFRFVSFRFYFVSHFTGTPRKSGFIPSPFHCIFPILHLYSQYNNMLINKMPKDLRKVHLPLFSPPFTSKCSLTCSVQYQITGNIYMFSFHCIQSFFTVKFPLVFSYNLNVSNVYENIWRNVLPVIVKQYISG